MQSNFSCTKNQQIFLLILLVFTLLTACKKDPTEQQTAGEDTTPTSTNPNDIDTTNIQPDVWEYYKNIAEMATFYAGHTLTVKRALAMLNRIVHRRIGLIH